MDTCKYMTLKEAITEYIDINDLKVYFYKNENYTFLEGNFFREHNIDKLNCVQKLLVELNLNTMCEVNLFVGIGKFVEVDKVYGVIIRVGKTTPKKSTYRAKFRTEEK